MLGEISKISKNKLSKFIPNFPHNHVITSTNNIIDNKKFLKTIKPFLSDKGQSTQKTTLVDKDENIISDDKEVAEAMNEFFSNAVTSLNLVENSYLLTNTTSYDPISNITEKHKNHPSIINIKENISRSVFSFREITLTEVRNELLNINCKKSTTHNNIPTNLLKYTVDIRGSVLHKLINDDCVFPDKLKLADITPVFKKGDATDINNYRPISVLPPVSKIFEKLLYTQISTYFEQY